MEPDIGLSDADSTNASDTKDEEDIVSRNESEEELSDSESSEGTTSSPQTSPRAGRDSPGSRRNRTNRISYSDFSYLSTLSRQERRRIEDEMIKGRKLGECKSLAQQWAIPAFNIEPNKRVPRKSIYPLDAGLLFIIDLFHVTS